MPAGAAARHAARLFAAAAAAAAALLLLLPFAATASQLPCVCLCAHHDTLRAVKRIILPPHPTPPPLCPPQQRARMAEDLLCNVRRVCIRGDRVTCDV